MELQNYESALKKACLVERNPQGILSLSRVSAHESSDIVFLATQIQAADDLIKSSACGKLSLILEQIKMLQAQAKEILNETEKNQMLHSAACNFAKKPGHIYHLYQRESGQKYFSMLTPEEWGTTCKQEFLGSFRLENDLSWTPLEDILKREESDAWAIKLLTSRNEKNLSIDST